MEKYNDIKIEIIDFGLELMVGGTAEADKCCVKKQRCPSIE